GGIDRCLEPACARGRRCAEEHAGCLREGARQLRQQEMTVSFRERIAVHPKPLLLAVALLLCGAAYDARATGGLYLGAGIGQATIKDDTSSVAFDADHAAYKGFVGYRFD